MMRPWRVPGANGYAYTYDGDGNRVRKSNGTLAANGTLYWYMTPGVDRVLTSGGHRSAIDAMPTLAQLVQRARGRISVMACGEISITNVNAVVHDTALTQMHAG